MPKQQVPCNLTDGTSLDTQLDSGVAETAAADVASTTSVVS